MPLAEVAMIESYLLPLRSQSCGQGNIKQNLPILVALPNSSVDADIDTDISVGKALACISVVY